MSVETRPAHQDRQPPDPLDDFVYATARDLTLEQRLERKVVEVSDREQARLGRELHDGLCQTLAGIAALSTALSANLRTHGDSAAAAAAAEIAMLLNDTIAQARDLARGLDPVGLRTSGLDAALKALARDTEHRFRISCTFSCDRPAPLLRQEVKMHLFRIAQEAVQNAVAHARAEWIDISLSGVDGQWLLRISDCGVGVPDEAHRRNGIGLYSMACRANLIRASLEVKRRAPRGTAITCAFSWPETLDTCAPSRDDDV